MSNKKCAICQDLLALYVDGLCSEESGQYIEEHFSECERCKTAFSDMKKEYVPKDISDEEKQSGDEFEMKLGRRWSRFKKKLILKITAIVLAVVALLGTGVYFAFFHYYTLTPDEVNINDLSVMSDGRIVFELREKDGDWWNSLRFEHKKDALYVTAESTAFEDYNPEELAFFNYADIDLEEYMDERKFLYEKSDSRGDKTQITQYDNATSNIKYIYYGNEDDKILIWEEGMELPAASEEVEEWFSSADE